MRLALLTLCTVLAHAPLAAAQEKMPDTADAHVQIPDAVQGVINDVRLLCEFPGGVFSFDPAHLHSADLNKDGIADHVLSAAGFACSDNETLYQSDQGYAHYLFLSNGPGTLRLDRSTSPVAYSVRIDQRPSPPHLIYEHHCKNTGTNRTFTRWSWSGTSMVKVSSTPPCSRW